MLDCCLGFRAGQVFSRRRKIFSRSISSELDARSPARVSIIGHPHQASKWKDAVGELEDQKQLDFKVVLGYAKDGMVDVKLLVKEKDALGEDIVFLFVERASPSATSPPLKH